MGVTTLVSCGACSTSLLDPDPTWYCAREDRLSVAPAQQALPAATLETELAQPVTVIRPAKGWISLRLSDLWNYRELLYFLVWRDVKVRYKQTALGAAWAILQPLATMVIFPVVFGRLTKVPSDGVPYPVFAYCALLPWPLFANAVSESSNSTVISRHLVKKRAMALALSQSAKKKSVGHQSCRLARETSVRDRQAENRFLLDLLPRCCRDYRQHRDVENNLQSNETQHLFQTYYSKPKNGIHDSYRPMR